METAVRPSRHWGRERPGYASAAARKEHEMRILVMFVTLLSSIPMLSSPALAHDEAAAMPDRLAFDFNLNRFQNTFALGLGATSPYLWDRIAVHVTGDLAFFEGDFVADGGVERRWEPHYVFKAGMIGVASEIRPDFRLYGEGGVVAILPDSSMSDESLRFGGYGVFGFELKARGPVSYFIELGSMGINARADKAVGKPIYSNGFTSTVGLKAYL
jgi:hypothetical protein